MVTFPCFEAPTLQLLCDFTEIGRCVCFTGVKIGWESRHLTTGAKDKLQWDITLHFNIWHNMRLWSVLSVYSDQCCHNRTVTPSINSLLASYPCRRFGGESGDRVSFRQPPPHPLHPTLVLPARHVDAQLFTLKVLYLSSPPWQPASLVSGSAHISPALSCLTCHAIKDDPQTCLPMSAYDE